MLFSKYDPLKKKQLQILNEKGEIVNKELEPKLDKETLVKMYKQAVLGRVADIKALQYQRQGRMLTYAPNRGHEAAQIGTAAAMAEQDWYIPGFRDFYAMLYRGVTLEQIYLYWYGNEWGSHFDEGVRVTPVNVIIGSQINHASGIAYASKLMKKNEVAVTAIGDGGTSHGEFYEGMNFAGVFNLPLVTLVQNNQYAISTPRAKATKAETLAQKAVAFGIPGIQVDGNDILAVYVAMKEAMEHARSGKGPVLVEAVTYRLGPHTTSDDPTLYREDSEVEIWEKKDPMIRFKKYMIDKGYWTEEEQKAYEEESDNYVGEVFRKVEATGEAELLDVFKYTYEEMTPQLIEQYETHKKFLEKGGK
ncbi:MAG: pyruvate dehydrogenase (acetyl-transferring) E1 component subunit alpha [Acholeplasmataceae bacterium]|nr:pyruvate dehydrogenase (acetyl-transferring) E1 component subunit alpha [Acholeplasmataceae bacterium]